MLHTRVEMMDALISLAEAHKQDQVALARLPWNAKVLLHQDRPHGIPRMTYARKKGAAVTAIAVIVPADGVDGLPCFHIGYAVREDQRGKGLATALARDAIEDMRRNIARMPGAEAIAVEAVVERDNTASIAVARKVFETEGRETVDDATGAPVLQFLRRLPLAG